MKLTFLFIFTWYVLYNDIYNESGNKYSGMLIKQAKVNAKYKSYLQRARGKGRCERQVFHDIFRQ